MMDMGVIDVSGSPPPFEPSQDPLEDIEYGDPPDKPGVLLKGELDGEQGPDPEVHAKIARAAQKLWQSKDKWIKELSQQWLVNAARRKGMATARLIRTSSDTVEFWAPRNATADLSPDINKGAQLARRLVSQMFTDPPAPNIVPHSDDLEDEAAAEMSGRMLGSLQDQLKTKNKARDAFSVAWDYGSGFTLTTADPRGGGRQAIEIEAHPLATHIDNALKDPASGQIDPMTGQMIPGTEEDVEDDSILVTRYVKPDGTLTTREGEAATRWTPALKKEVLTGRHVRPIPHNVHTIDDAEGVQIGKLYTVRSVRRMYPDLMEQLEEKEIDAMAGDWDEAEVDLLQAGDSDTELHGIEGDETTEEKLVLVIRTYIKPGIPGYPDGLELITLGSKWVAWRESWIHETSKGVRIELPLPVAQYAQWGEGRLDFYHTGGGELIGGANTARAAQVTRLLEHLEYLNNPQVLLPYDSMLTPQQLMNKDQKVLYFNARAGQPVIRQYQPYPRDSFEAFGLLGQEMQDAIGLQESATSGVDPSVTSGRQLYGIIGQVHAGLSELRDNIIDGYLRDCRIEMELARAFLTVPQLLRYETDGGEYKVRRWLGADLKSNVDIELKPGTMTMLSPEAKARFHEMLFDRGIITHDQMKEAYASNLSQSFSILADDPFRNRIRGQISAWMDGPPEGWAEERGMLEQQAQMQNTMPEPDPMLARMWAPVPADELPQIAQTRLDALARVVSSPTYQDKPFAWRAPVEQEFKRMMKIVQMAAMMGQVGGAPGKPPEPREEPNGPPSPLKESDPQNMTGAPS